MNILIDTHLNDVVIMLFENNKLIKEKTVTGEKQNSKVIMPLIKKVLGKKTPESVIVVNGPGSFTGVRLGVTIAKTLAHTMNIPVRSISSLDCLALSCDSDEKIIAFSDNNGYYVGIFDIDNTLVGSYEYLTNSQFEEFSNKYEVHTDLTIDYNKVYSYVLEKEPVDAKDLNPIYIKKLDVEK